MTPLVYLRQELNFTLAEWQALEQDDKDWLRTAAQVEMNLIGVEITQPEKK